MDKKHYYSKCTVWNVSEEKEYIEICVEDNESKEWDYHYFEYSGDLYYYHDAEYIFKNGKEVKFEKGTQLDSYREWREPNTKTIAQVGFTFDELVELMTSEKYSHCTSLRDKIRNMVRYIVLDCGEMYDILKVAESDKEDIFVKVKAAEDELTEYNRNAQIDAYRFNHMSAEEQEWEIESENMAYTR